MATTVGQHQVSPFAGPVAGSPRSAAAVKANDDALRAVVDAHDSETGIHVQSGVVASRPAAGTLGQKWLTTDSGARYLTYDDGAAWLDLSYAKLTGAAFTGAVTGTTVSLSGTFGVALPMAWKGRGSTTVSAPSTVNVKTAPFQPMAKVWTSPRAAGLIVVGGITSTKGVGIVAQSLVAHL